jgi:hypothetical protein
VPPPRPSFEPLPPLPQLVRLNKMKIKMNFLEAKIDFNMRLNK